MVLANPLRDSLTLVIPVFNEEAALPRLLPQVVDCAKTWGWKLILVNDGSCDRSQSILAEYCDDPAVTLLRHKVNRGYGGALKTGLAAVQTEYAVTLDADGQHRLEDVQNMLRFLVEQDADMVIGARQGSGNSGWYRAMGKSIIRGLAKLLLPLHIQDLNSGLKIYRTKLVQRYLPLCPNSMAFSDIVTLVMISEGHLVLEYPVQTLARASGKSTINTLTAFDTLYEILNIVVLFKPMRIFFPAAVFFGGFGALWGLPILFMGRGVSVGSLMLIMIGIILLFLGLVTEQLVRIEKEILLIKQ